MKNYSIKNSTHHLKDTYEKAMKSTKLESL